MINTYKAGFFDEVVRMTKSITNDQVLGKTVRGFVHALGVMKPKKRKIKKRQIVYMPNFGIYY